MNVMLYGASDNLVEIEGDVREEFYYDEERTNYVAFSDGTLVKVLYDGDWHLTVVTRGDASVTKFDAPGDGESYDSELAELQDVLSYSDVVVLGTPRDKPILWALHGVNVAKYLPGEEAR